VSKPPHAKKGVAYQQTVNPRVGSNELTEEIPNVSVRHDGVCPELLGYLIGILLAINRFKSTEIGGNIPKFHLVHSLLLFSKALKTRILNHSSQLGTDAGASTD
jgi:hypothetical protein